MIPKEGGFLDADAVLYLLSDGWELGSTTGIRAPSRVTMQKKLGHGGKHFRVRRNTLEAMLRRGKVVPLRPRSGQHFATVRYGLPTSPEAAKPGENWTVV